MSAVAAEIRKEVPRAVMVSPGRHQLFRFSNNRHFVTAEEGTTPADVCKPEFLGHVARKVRMYDEIIVVNDTGDFWMRLIALQTGPTWVRTKALELVDLKDDAKQVTADPMNPYTVEFKGPVRKWICLRKDDGQPVKEQMTSRAEAEAFMRDYISKTTGG